MPIVIKEIRVNTVVEKKVITHQQARWTDNDFTES